MKLKPFLLGGTVALALLAGCDSQKAKPAPKPPKVTVALPEKRSVLEYEDLPGRVVAIEDVVIKARVTGYLSQVNFKEGTEVKKGDLLYVIDPREYQADVDSATAAVQQAEARLAQGQSDYERAHQLSKQTAISQQELETKATEMREDEGGVRAAQASLARAQLNLEYTSVRAPICGKISRTDVTIGNLVQNGETLTRIVSQDPVYVYFEAPERTVLRWDKDLKAAGAGSLVEKARVFVGLVDETDFPREGKVNFTDNELNAGTGTLSMRATLPNPNRDLRVGLYARVRLSLDMPEDALLVPERAVGIDQGQRYVYVVGPDDKVEYRKVVVGQAYGEKRAIRSGLKPNERIIVAGMLVARPGIVVVPEMESSEVAKEP